MKELLWRTIVLTLAITVGFSFAFAGQDETGNGSPSGAHYNLNIIGVPNDKSADMDGNNGHRIFVPLSKKAKIFLTESDDFDGIQVLDANGTDGNGAAFALPNPDSDGDGITVYSVYVRALGKPGGQALMQSCYTDESGEEWCASDLGLNNSVSDVTPVEITRQNGKGKSTFINVSKDLLYVDFCALWDLDETSFTYGECLDVDQVPLFSQETLGYLWDYDNHGLKLAQLRFYEILTDTGWTDTDGLPEE
jgi:hypothetical protein